MTNLSTFAFEGKQVRFVGTLEEPEWIAADVCNILELNTSQAVNRRKDRLGSGLDEDEKGIDNDDTLRSEQEMLTVKKPGLYRLLSKSRKATPKRFQRWVFHNVLSSICKTGSYYISPTASPPTIPSARDRLETIQLGIHLFQELGGCDPRTELMLKEYGKLERFAAKEQIPVSSEYIRRLIDREPEPKA